MIVLGFDPGETTGYVAVEIELGKLVVTKNHALVKVEEGQFPNSSRVEELLDKIKPDIVVFEEFRLYGHTLAALAGSSVIPAQVIGIIKHELFKRQIKWQIQMASQAKAFYNDKRLKDLGLYSKGIKHSRDALRHVLYWISFGKKKYRTGIGYYKEDEYTFGGKDGAQV